MANRLTSERGGQIGLWISKAGTNVLTTSNANMILTSEEKCMQVAHSGTTPNFTSQGSTGISWPALGFRPMIIASCPRWRVTILYNSDNNATLSYWNRDPVPPPGASGVITWYVTNIPV